MKKCKGLKIIKYQQMHYFFHLFLWREAEVLKDRNVPGVYFCAEFVPPVAGVKKCIMPLSFSYFRFRFWILSLIICSFKSVTIDFSF